MIKTIRYWIIKIVGVSKGEANALLILVPILLLVIIVPPFFYRHFTSNYSNHISDQTILDSLLAQIEANQQRYTDSIYSTTNIKHTIFDPNTASATLLQSNGIPSYLTKRIINYREKGGRFRNKKDLHKIYGMRDDLYKSLLPYINIASKSKIITVKPSYTSYYKKRVIVSFDINTADTSTFKQIRGIGSKLSFRLVYFRDKLGGFINIDQLYEVYGLKPEVIDSLLIYGSISANFSPSQLNINTDTTLHLSQHPYISYRLANTIVSYRRQHGHYRKVTQIKNIHLVNDSLYNKISPYLKTAD